MHDGSKLHIVDYPPLALEVYLHLALEVKSSALVLICNEHIKD